MSLGNEGVWDEMEVVRFMRNGGLQVFSASGLVSIYHAHSTIIMLGTIDSEESLHNLTNLSARPSKVLAAFSVQVWEND